MFNSKSRPKSQPASLDGTDLYAAEAILDSKVDKDGVTKFLIKWLGWGHQFNSWEPLENIASQSLIDEFEQHRAQGLSYKSYHKSSVGSGAVTHSRKHHKKHDKHHSKAEHKSSKSIAVNSGVQQSHSNVDQISTKGIVFRQFLL